ncbi:S41 family peptidase [Micromonospora sp. CPCC 205371]|nr:S41 family peptidase [Micromonospora sp. CPCC 205371]
MTIRELVERLIAWTDRLFPDPPRAAVLSTALRDAFSTRTDEVTAGACAEITAVAHTVARHLELRFEPEGTEPADTQSRGWPPPDGAAVRSEAGGVRDVHRTADGTAVIRIDSLHSIQHARPYIDAAFDLARGAPRIVVDLRHNGGGDPATLAAVCGRLLGAATHLSDVRYRERHRQWWTPEPTPGATLTAPVHVLVSAQTYSSGEALAYHLQAQGRATIVGAPTAGAADHVTPIRLAPTVTALVPEAVVIDTVTGANWEGKGVIPDIACPADQALSKALGLASPR